LKQLSSIKQAFTSFGALTKTNTFPSVETNMSREKIASTKLLVKQENMKNKMINRKKHRYRETSVGPLKQKTKMK
jgi:methionine synthase I (cobalamin-dependent)